MSNLADSGEIYRSRLPRVIARRCGALGIKMSVHQMVCHLDDSYKLGLGRKTAAPATGLISRSTLLKWIALRVATAVGERISYAAGDGTRQRLARPQWSSQQDLRSLLATLDRFCDIVAHALPVPHPIFREMTSVGLDAVGISARGSSSAPVWAMNVAPAVPSARHPRRAADARPLFLRGFLRQYPCLARQLPLRLRILAPALLGLPYALVSWSNRLFPLALACPSIRCCQWASACCSTKQTWLTRHSAGGWRDFFILISSRPCSGLTLVRAGVAPGSRRL